MSIISHSYVSAFWLQLHILRCGLDGTVLKCPSLPVDNVACCACARIPDGALGKIIVARKHRALAGWKHEGAVCICKTINFSTKFFITNEQYEPRNGELYYFVYICVSIYLFKFLMNHLFSCCFEITITSGGQPHPRCGQLVPNAAGCVIFCPMDWWSRIVNSGTVHRKYTCLPRRIDRNEYYFALLYIVRQVTSSYSALQFRRNSPVFWCFEIPCQNIRYRVAHACGSRCTRGCKYRAPLWFTENIRLLMWILSIAISIIDLNVHRWSTKKLM